MRLVVGLIYVFSCLGIAQDLPKLRLVSEVMPPYQYYDGEQVVGKNIEQLKKVFTQSNLPFPGVELYPWARSFKIASEQQNTFIFPIVRTPEREKQFTWVAPMATATYSLFGLKSREDIQLKREEDVAAFKIAVTKDDITHKYFKKLGFEEGEHFLISSDWLLIEKLFFNDKLGLMVSTHAHFAVQANRNNIDVNLYEEKLTLSDLSLRYYLAANKKTTPQLINRIKQAFPKQPIRY
ncbi:substrate-binding periplasmic protein [Aliiglaciecola sp. M165]|uniref:substrate-binding periplasmic protein n=1 Tax=Aliiglaciecola sp. M165 TaxID=2593649 RepID=UPI00117D9684|nr:transporter substrate-binding domain-containing protein [Aliiglaciecola sp. M165]TRY31487.1 transporter substrate-binding domain-containing protein [Aliiglaciecola sp. M165]